MLNLYPQRFPFGAVLCFGFALLYSLYNWLPLLDATWSIIDDHDIVSVIGSRDRLPVSEIPDALSKTEVGRGGLETRFRPSYYSIRYLEAATWGKQPSLWYAARIAIFSIFALTLTAVCLRMGRPILTFGFLVFELSRPYWFDIFGRLGPGETYAVLGVSLTMIGFIVADKKGWSALPCLFVTAGIVIAAGSKENFVILAALPFWLIFSPTLRLSLKSKSIVGIALAYIAWVSINVINGLRHVGHDVYAQPISIESRFDPLYSFATRSDILVLLTICLSLFAFIFVLWARHGNIQEKPWLKNLHNYALGILTMLALILSQHLFYGGKWPIDVAPRYLFPGMLAEHMAVFLFFVVVAKMVSIMFRRLAGYVWVIYLAGALFFLTLTAGNIDFDKEFPAESVDFNKKFSVEKTVDNITLNRAASIKMVSGTTSFMNRLDEAFVFLETHPSAILIINSNSVWDYEPIFSIQRFIQASGLTNSVALNISGYSLNSFSKDSQKLEFLLTVDLEKVQNSGKGGFVPLRTIDPVAACFSMGMSGPPLARCESGNIIWP